MAISILEYQRRIEVLKDGMEDPARILDVLCICEIERLKATIIAMNGTVK